MVSQRAAQIQASPTMAITQKAQELRAAGQDVIGFGAGEPDFNTPDNVCRAGIQAIEDGFTKYTAASGIPELKKAVCEKFTRDNGLDYDISEIIISCGAKSSLYHLVMALIDPGDEVVIPAPYWVTFPEQIRMADGIPIYLETSEADEFRLTADALKSKLSDKTKAIILNSPSNPTGAVIDPAELEKIAAVAVDKGIYVISDECYEKIIYDDNRHVCIASISPQIKELTLVVNAVSKSHSMTGWRIGYTAGPKDIIKAMANIQSHSTSNPTSISQKAAVEALTGPEDELKRWVAEFDKRRHWIVDGFNDIEGASCLLPGGAFYAFPNVKGLLGRSWNDKVIESSLDLTSFFLEEALVAVVPGVAFGVDGYLRMSYATSLAKIESGLERIKEAAARLS